MEYVNLQPRAKINLCLDVTGRLENGYHEVKMVMQTLKLHDSLFIKRTNNSRIELKTNHPDVPVNDKNLVYAACEIMLKKFNLSGGLYIELFKRIPVAAGLGGGSSDAAAALKGMRKLYGLNVSDDELCETGLSLGADVPFFIRGGTALAEGIGEKLTILPRHPFVHVLLCKPCFSVSTASVYRELKLEDIINRPNTDAVINALNRGDIHKIANNMGNVLETVTEGKYPVLRKIKALMTEHGSLKAMMSGSGPTVFGYFINRQNAIDAGLALSNFLGGDCSVFLTGTT